jgi:hypothetical protein
MTMKHAEAEKRLEEITELLANGFYSYLLILNTKTAPALTRLVIIRGCKAGMSCRDSTPRQVTHLQKISVKLSIRRSPSPSGNVL